MADRALIDAAIQGLKDAANDPNPDYSWQRDLPEVPLPEHPDETLVVFIPSRRAPDEE